MQDTTKVGKYINDDIGYLGTPTLNHYLNEILIKIGNYPDKKEAKKALSKLKLTRLEVFEDSAFIINHILKSEDYKKKIIEISKKLDIYVKKNEIDFSSIIDFANDLSSKMKFYSALAIRNIKDKASEDELKELNKDVKADKKDAVDMVLSNYRNWIKKIKSDKELYGYLEKYEPKSKKIASELMEATIARMEELKNREERLLTIALHRRISIEKFKKKSIHRTYNTNFE